MELEHILAKIPPEAAERVKSGISKPLSYEEQLEMRKTWSNAQPGNLTGTDCPVCKNRGYMAEIKDGYLVSVECVCMAKRRSIRRIERSGMKELLERNTLDNFQTKTKWQSGMKQRAISFLADGAKGWFAALGSVGAGKTHLCTAICGELLNGGREVRYMLWRDESMKIKAAASDSDEYERLIYPLKTVSVLYIDDLFKTQRGVEIRQADVNLAFELLNYRYCNERLTTILSSEKTMDELMNIDEAIGSRIYERCKDRCIELEGDKNWRLKC